MTQTEQIKTEIERRIEDIKNLRIISSRTDGIIEELIELLSFIDSLPNETPQGLDKAAELSANRAVVSRQSSMDGRVIYDLKEKCFDHSDLITQFKAGANWQMANAIRKEIEREE